MQNDYQKALLTLSKYLKPVPINLTTLDTAVALLAGYNQKTFDGSPRMDEDSLARDWLGFCYWNDAGAKLTIGELLEEIDFQKQGWVHVQGGLAIDVPAYKEVKASMPSPEAAKAWLKLQSDVIDPQDYRPDTEVSSDRRRIAIATIGDQTFENVYTEDCTTTHEAKAFDIFTQMQLTGLLEQINQAHPDIAQAITSFQAEHARRLCKQVDWKEQKQEIEGSGERQKC